MAAPSCSCAIVGSRPGCLVGGELEPDETPLEAAHRELREETGLEGRARDALG